MCIQIRPHHLVMPFNVRSMHALTSVARSSQASCMRKKTLWEWGKSARVQVAIVCLSYPFFTTSIHIIQQQVLRSVYFRSDPILYSFTHSHHSNKSEQERTAAQSTIMSSSSMIVTLASDFLVLGAGVSIVAIGLGYFLYQNRKYLPASVNAIIGDIQNHTREDDGLKELR